MLHSGKNYKGEKILSEKYDGRRPPSLEIFLEYMELKIKHFAPFSFFEFRFAELLFGCINVLASR